jgi:DNA polymerase III epsilon subunit-like protein
MHIYRKLYAQALVCVMLLSPVMGIEAFSDREWLYNGRVITCDLEADPALGGRITEIALIKWEKGTYIESFHRYLNPEGKINNPYVKSVYPIDPSKQPTFADIAQNLIDFIDGGILVTWGTFDVRKLGEEFTRTLQPGEKLNIRWKDALAMARRDYRRGKGAILASPLSKITAVIGKPDAEIKKEYAKKREAARKRREQTELNKYLKAREAAAKGLPPPHPKKRKSPYDVSFTQESTAKRCEVTAALGAASIGADADGLNHEHGIPKEHVGQAHHAMHDTQILTGLVAAMGQKALARVLDLES